MSDSCRWARVEQTAFELNRGLWREVRPRIGARTVVGIPVRWRVPVAATPRPAAGRRRRSSEPVTPPTPPTQPAVVHDLSVTGARLLIPADDAIVPHASFDLELDGAWVSARVAWLEESAHPSARWCGVSFVHPDPAFLAAVGQATGQRPGLPTTPLSWEEGGSGGFSA